MGAKLQAAITQMNSGQIAPLMEGRTDVQIYPYALRTEKNAVPLVYGSNKNRGGSAFAGAVKNAANKTALIPFKVGENVAYQIEIGHNYLRFYKNHELILKNDAPYEVQTDYALADLFDASGVLQIDYQQSADVLYLVHDKYPPRKLSRFADDNWTLTDLDIVGGPWQTLNTDTEKIIKASAQSGIVTLSSNIGANPYLVTPTVQGHTSSDAQQHYEIRVRYGGDDGRANQVAYLEFNSRPQRTFAEYVASMVNSSVSDWIATNPTTDTVRIVAINNQASYSGQKVNIEVYHFYSSPGGFPVYSTKYTNTTFIQEYASTDIFTADMVGITLRLTQVNANVQTWHSGLVVSSVGTLVKSDGHYYSAESTGTCGTVKPTHTEGSENDGGVVWKYLHDGYGWGVITAYTSPTQVSMRVYGLLPAGVVSSGTYKWEFGLFGANGIWPSSVVFFKDRLGLGINAESGPQICFSCTGDYENFADMENGEVLATSAITLPILSDLNKINWLCAQDNLFVGTEGGILAVKAMTSSEVFGPDNITYDNISSVGTCKIKPIRIGDDILYLGRLAKDIYAIQYNWESDSYAPDEISLMAYDLLEKGIKAWTLQYEPNRIIWAVRNDGKLIGLTYNKKQEVRGFHWHNTDGDFESVSCIPAPDGTADEVYAIVKRTINNAVVRYVEYLKNGLPLNIPSGLTKAQELTYLLKNCWFLDCAKKYTFDTATDTITGLNHLEGKTVAVLADGKVQASKIVASGSITLESAAGIVLVGLPYETIIELMPRNFDIQNGTGQARSQRINQMICRLYRSANFKYSWDGANWHEAEVKGDNELTLKSGDLVLNWGDSNTFSKLNSEDIVNATGARMIFKQDKPLPVCFVAFYPQIEVSNG